MPDRSIAHDAGPVVHWLIQGAILCPMVLKFLSFVLATLQAVGPRPLNGSNHAID